MYVETTLRLITGVRRVARGVPLAGARVARGPPVRVEQIHPSLSRGGGVLEVPEVGAVADSGAGRGRVRVQQGGRRRYGVESLAHCP